MKIITIRLIFALCFFILLGTQHVHATPTAYSGPSGDSGSTTTVAPLGSTLTVWGWPLGPTKTAWATPFGTTLTTWGWPMGPTKTAWGILWVPDFGATLSAWGYPLVTTGTAWGMPFVPETGSTLTMWGFPFGATRTSSEKIKTLTITPTVVPTATPELSKKYSFVPWTDKRLLGFLAKQNRSRVVYMRSLKIVQGKQPRDLYFQIGKEEKRENKRQRPILTNAPSQLPFSKGTEFVVRVDRRYAIDLKIELDFIAAIRTKHKTVSRTPIKKVYVYITPGKREEIVLRSSSGRFTYAVPRKTHCKKVRFQIRDGDERHTITVRFIHYKKKVSFE
jgi:hypothetical protein